MANLDSSSIANGGTIEASHITNLYDALTGTTTYDNISIAGTASIATTAASATSASYANTSTSASYSLTASYAANAGGADINTGSFYVGSSASNATITFTQGDSTTEQVTVNNVANATSASYALTSTSANSATTATSATSASYALTASYAMNGGGGGGGGTADALAAGGELEGLTTMSGHIIPSTNTTYDIGSAEYKIRHLYLSSNSLYMSGSGGWMTGSFDGTNLRINNNALVKSAVTSSMAVGSATTATSATTAITSTNVSSFISAGEEPIPVNLSFLAGSATLQNGTVNIESFSQQLAPNVLGQNCFITVTDFGGSTGGRFTVSLSQGIITITELSGGSSNGTVNFTVMYVKP